MRPRELSCILPQALRLGEGNHREAMVEGVRPKFFQLQESAGEFERSAKRRLASLG